MARFRARTALQVIAFVGLAVSAWLLGQYLLPPALSVCGPNGGCSAVRHCVVGRVGGDDLPFWPFLGVVAYAGLLTLSLSTMAFARRALLVAGTMAGIVGGGLLIAQPIVCHAFCPYCVVTDTSGLIACALVWYGRNEEVEVTGLARGAFALASIFAVVGSVGYAVRVYATPRPIQANIVAQLPAPVAHEQRAGVATIVEFADFECPYCRRQHLEMTEALASYGSRVRLVRKHVPLAMHPHAETAARAACCAEEQGRRDDMADALFRSEDLTAAGCEAIASRIGIDLTLYRSCVDAPRTTERLHNDRQDATQSEVTGLPTTFVGNERFDGVVPAVTLRQSIDRALAHGST